VPVDGGTANAGVSNTASGTIQVTKSVDWLGYTQTGQNLYYLRHQLSYPSGNCKTAGYTAAY